MRFDHDVMQTTRLSAVRGPVIIRSRRAHETHGLSEAMMIQENDTNLWHLVEGSVGRPRTERLFRVTQTDPGLLQAEIDRVAGKAGVVLLAGEPLFLRGGDDAPVVDERRRAVVIEGRDSQDAHRRLRRGCR